MFGENYKWNYDYVRLACDSGFAFEKSKGSAFDKNKISSIDIDRIIRERDIASVENFIPFISHFVLDPEQAAILDEHFAKVFRLSQLTVEYLLFCKKYLDNTLNQVKEEITRTKEENKELTLFVEDLKQHISVLMKDLKEKSALASFKCQHCNKIFSTEEFLNSHIKRRHSNEINTSLELETDKLHMEIKELKGRLNSAEKLIQKDQNQLKPVHDTESDHKLNELKKIDELQQKFEDLRVQVQSELKVLQTQYNFQEKYEKLFEKVALQNSQSKKDETEDLGRRRESTTQTEMEAKVQATSNFLEVEMKDKENIPDLTNARKQITEFGEALEVKVTTSLDKIERQMESFWNKLHEMEMHKKSHIEQNNDENQVPPPVKPRSKYTIKHSSLNVEKEVDESEVIQEIVSPDVKKKKKVHIKAEKLQSQRTVEKKEPVKNEETKLNLPSAEDYAKTTISSEISLSDSESDTIVSSEVSNKEIVSKLRHKSLHLPVENHSSYNYSNKKLEVSPELFEHFKEEVEKIMVMGRLQDLGVSPEWKGLPTRSFQRALEIVNHKANLMKKTYPNYDKIATQIERDVNRKLKNEITNRNLKNTPKEKLIKHKKVTTVSKKGKTPSPQIEIKNRKMYETDSDSERGNITKVKGDLRQFSVPYSAVIEELKSVTTKFDSSDKSVSDVNSVREESLKNEETKGVLKNYPSVVSLTKKKVLFNLKNDENQNKATNNHKETGSTTTITSSVFDGSPNKAKPVKNVKDIEDLSDFDFSDM